MADTTRAEGPTTADSTIEGRAPAGPEAPSTRLLDDRTAAEPQTSAPDIVTVSGAPDPDAGDRCDPQVSSGPNNAGSEPADGRRRRVGVIPGFTLLRQLGSGAVGVVFLARDELLGRDVALKVIRAGAEETPATFTRLGIGGAAVVHIDHPNVVRVFAVGVHAGQRYLVMEYVSRGSLAERVGDRPWPPLTAAWMVEEVARGVAAAHAQGVVHRDLKPANILLDAEGRPKVADFGLARLLGDGPIPAEAVLGTPAYMAPEQAAGAPIKVGPTADVYALGALLYELLTGRPPFQGATTLETLELARAAEPVPPRLFQPKVPRDLEAVCLTCLRKDPRYRYPDAAALANDLHRVRAGEPICTRTPSLREEFRLLRTTLPWRAGTIAGGLAVAAMASIRPLESASGLPGVVAFWAAMLASLRPSWLGLAAVMLSVSVASAVSWILGAEVAPILEGLAWGLGLAVGLGGNAQLAARRCGRSVLESLSGVLLGGFCGWLVLLILVNAVPILRPPVPLAVVNFAMLTGAFVGALAYGPVSAWLDLRRLRRVGRSARPAPSRTRPVGAGSSALPMTIEDEDRASAVASTGPWPVAQFPAEDTTAPHAPPWWPQIDGFEVLSTLGGGGMGVVYLARQVGLDRLVALKLIQPEGRGAVELRERFLVEGRAAARLDHPGIARVYELGESGGQLYAALEYLPGGNLARRLRGRTLPAREAAELGEALARAVGVAHHAGIVHRDLKPANILLDAEGRPKVADFGLAKLLDDADGRTRTHAVLGTPSYMAPEQAWGRSRAAGPAADVYALGALLYEFLTGRPPFRGVTLAETLEMVRLHDVVPPRRLQPGLPRDLEAICLKCLEKDPARRYSDASALADDLHHFLDHEPTRARPPGLIRRLWAIRVQVDRASSQKIRLAMIVITWGVMGVVTIATSQVSAGVLTGLVTCMALYFWDRRRR